VVSTGQRLVRVIVRGRSRCDSGSGVGGVVRRTVVARSRGKRATSSGTSDGDGTSHLSIASGTVLAAAAKELDTGTLGVAVGGRRAVALLLLVNASEAELDESGHKEQKTIMR
jgi:hypothetical protein